MAALFGSVRSDFQVVGELIDRRLVTSEKQKDWKLYILKIAAKGCTLEIQVAEKEYEEAIVKAPYHITGSVTVESGRMKLIAEDVKILSEPRATA